MPDSHKSVQQHLPDGIIPNTSAKVPMTIGLAVAGAAGIVAYLAANMAASEGKVLLEAAMPSMRFMSSAIATASATVVGLMLTLLGLSRSMDIQFGAHHYERVESIARLSCVAFAGSVVFLLILTLPIQDSENVPFKYYDELYSIFLVISASLAAALTAVVLMLYQEIVGLVQAVHPGAEMPDTLIKTSEGDSGRSDAARQGGDDAPASQETQTSGQASD